MNLDPEERRDYVYNQLDEYGRLYMNCLELFVHKLWCRQKMLFRNNKIYEEKLATISEVIGALTSSDQIVAANKNESERLESTIHKINQIVYIPPPLDRNGLALVNDLLVKETTDNFAKFNEPSYSGSLCELSTEEGPLNLNLSSCNQAKTNRSAGVIKGSSSSMLTNNIPSVSIPLATNQHSYSNQNSTSSPSAAPVVSLSSSSTSSSTTPSVIKTNTSSSHHHHHHLHHHQSNGNDGSDKCSSNCKRKIETENDMNNHHLMRFKMGRDLELHPEDDSYVEEQITADSYEIEEDEDDDEEEEIEVDLSGNSIQSYLNNREPIGASVKDLSHQRSSVLRRFRRPIVDSEIVKCCIQMGCRYLERQNANHMRKHYRSWHNDIAYPKNPYVKVDMTAEAITEHLEAWMLQRKNRQQRATLKNSEVL
ncbi:uncharacterized protein LOC107362518 [Tetranychus urticae]|uniref:uncharacterized protein LOC107362518 n=1 Tax=Tetranychus urticae TaxID=32264 RepID=UPI00077BD281|nr:uncharacterized protein LOC107362518 [Tetranychus urticae]XP_015785091.1 uncharacterized protein LOC107362518 [Tetranychus urticae]XP_015785092.1 uncharacterized protein LOC107362518 [Tetranychus urticae]